MDCSYKATYTQTEKLKKKTFEKFNFCVLEKPLKFGTMKMVAQLATD